MGGFVQLGDLAAVLDDRGAGDVVLVGHSGAGGTAIGLALARPARVRGLLLLAPGVQDGLTELGIATWAAAGDGPEVRKQISGAAGAFFRLGDFERPGPPAYPRLGEVSAPAIVVTGDREYPMVARCAAEIAARIPGCRQVPAPGADHMLPLRAPDLIAALAAKLAG